MKVKIYAASALGDYTSVQERISVGAVDMAVQPAAAAADRKMQISSFPYIAENWNQARKIYGPGGAIYDRDEDAVRQAGHHHAGGLPGLLRRDRTEP